MDQAYFRVPTAKKTCKVTILNSDCPAYSASSDYPKSKVRIDGKENRQATTNVNVKKVTFSSDQMDSTTKTVMGH